jgi:hypothetical protein
MVRLRHVLVACALLVLTVAVVQAGATKHRHKIKEEHFFNDVVLPPKNDPQSAGVESVEVQCPEGFEATGGGYVSDVIAIVPFAKLQPGKFSVIGINQTNDRSRLEADVACIKGKTSKKKAKAGGPSLQDRVEAYRRQRR